MNKFKKQLYISQRFLERSNTWTFQVQIRMNGYVVLKNFREKEFGSARIAYDQAISFRDKTISDIVNNIYIDKNNKTVEDCFNESFDLMPISLATKNKHLYYFKNFEQYKNMFIQELKPESIQMHLNGFVDVCDDDTIQRIFSVWKRIIKTALIKRYINKDLCSMVIVPESRFVSKKKDKRAVTKDDFYIVLDLLRKSKLSNYIKTMYINFLLTLYYTGARPCEILALNKNDIKNGMIYINKELGSSQNKSGVIRKTKTPLSNRTIPINKQLSDVLKSTSKLNNFNVLFCKEDGSYFSQRKICQRLGRICKGKVEFNMYGLRHLFSTDLLMNGVDAKTHQELMGHSSYEMSLYYVNSSEELKKKAIEDR